MDVRTGQPVEAVDIDAELVDRRDDIEVVLLRKREVFLSAAGRDVDDAGAFVGADVVPGDDAVLDVLICGEFVERSACRRVRSDRRP